MIVLDTHTLIGWIQGDGALSDAASQAIQHTLDQGELLLISAITSWEIALLVSSGQLKLSMNTEKWLSTIASIEGVKFVPVDNDIALQSVQLPGEFHNDPADRMIVALARYYSIPVVTKDEKIRHYQYVKSIW